MFDQLTASRARRERRGLHALAAVAIHLAVLLVAAQLTRAHAIAARAHMMEHTLPPIMRPPAATPLRSHQVSRATSTAATPLPSPSRLAVPLPVDLPSQFPRPAVPPPSRWWGTGSAPGTGTPASPDGDSTSRDSAFRLDQVSVPARYLRGPVPRYPLALHTTGIEGTVQLRYIIGTDSLADPSSIVVIGATRSEFAVPAIDAIRQARFAPATWHGQPVRQLVEQTVRFSIGH
jgi:TonB family protein